MDCDFLNFLLSVPQREIKNCFFCPLLVRTTGLSKIIFDITKEKASIEPKTVVKYTGSG